RDALEEPREADRERQPPQPDGRVHDREDTAGEHEQTEQARTERGLDRLVNFSDATVAIATPIIAVFGLDSMPEPGVMPSAVCRLAQRPVAGVKMNTQMREIVADG
ncbi:hypothetical protein IAE22_33455, partial [Bacillus sp. S34]|nr:hypothetical protein [Bacillus sp. S34]